MELGVSANKCLQVQSYFHREIFTVCFVLGAFWPLCYGAGFVKKHALLSLSWFVGCLLMSTFTLLPANKVEEIGTMYIYPDRFANLLTLADYICRTWGGLLMFFTGLLYLLFENRILGKKGHPTQSSITLPSCGSRTIMGMQVCTAPFATPRLLLANFE